MCRVLVCLLAAALLAPGRASGQQTWYVDDNAPGDPGPGNPASSDPLEDGSAGHPYDAIQQAVNRAATGDTVLVLPGTYKGNGNRNIEFFGKGLVVRSRDGPLTCTINVESMGQGFQVADREPVGTQIRGFTIREASSSGIYVGFLAKCAVMDCRLINNNSPGIWVDNEAVVLMDGCTVTNNSTIFDGGGVRIENLSVLYLTNSTIARNTASRDGGGVSASSSYLFCYNTIVTDNTAGGTVFGGGGVIYYRSDGTFANSLVAANRTNARDGGGVFCNFDAIVALAGNTIAQNRAARNGGGLYADTVPLSSFANSVVWSNTPQGVFQGSGPMPVSYCDVQGGYAGTGNIAVNPMFADPDGTDGNPMTGLDNDYRLLAASPCIDAGNSNAIPPDEADLDGDTLYGEPTPYDLDGFDRMRDVFATPDTGLGDPVVDMGSYEAEGVCAVDFNGDGVVDFADYLEFLNLFDARDPRADLNGDGVIDFVDYLEFLNQFEAGC